jgi:hypothetical protein
MPGPTGDEGARRRLWALDCAGEELMLACAAPGTGEALLPGAEELLAASTPAGARGCAEVCCWGVFMPEKDCCCCCSEAGVGAS